MTSFERRVVIVENPRSSKARKIAHEVIGLLDRQNIPYESIITRYKEADANIHDLAEQILDGDQVIVAAGDGTASQFANAALLSTRDVEIGFLPYGNFNDIASTYTSPKSTVIDLLRAEAVSSAPLTITLDGQHWRHAVAYVTIGWSAIAASSFDHPLSRQLTGVIPSRRLMHAASLLQLAHQYYKHRAYHLPRFTTDQSNDCHNITDIVAANSPVIAGSIGSDIRWYNSTLFGYSEVDVSRLLPNLLYGLQSLARRMPLEPMEVTTLDFGMTVDVPSQSDGEYNEVTARQITLSKDPMHHLSILSTTH